MQITLDDRRNKRRTVELVSPHPGQRVLDVGCGTGTLTLMLKAAYPSVEVVGVDGDPDMVRRARDKARARQIEVDFQHHRAEALSLPDRRFDHVTTTLLLHHLNTSQKRAALREAKRVLRSPGILHVCDWGVPQGLVAAVGFLGVRLFDGLERTSANAHGLLPQLIEEAGFTDVQQVDQQSTLLGTLSFLTARTD